MLRIFWIVLLLPLALKGQTLTVNTTMSMPGGTYTDIVVENGGTLTAGSLSGFNTITVNLGGVMNAASIGVNTLTLGGTLSVTSSLTVTTTVTSSGVSILNLTNATAQFGALNITGTSDINFDNSDLIITGEINQDGGNIVLDHGSELTVNGLYDASGSSTIEMSDASKVVCGGDFNNHTGYSFLPITHQADFTFNAAFPQTIDGFNKFYNLTFSGGSKTVLNTGSSEVTNILDIGSELVELNQELTISNGAVSSLVRGAGFFFCKGTSGKFTRNTSSTDPYVFPVGSDDEEYNYRPVVIVPSSSPGQFSAKFVVGDLPHPYTELGENLFKVNRKYYHRVVSSIEATIYFYHDPEVDNEWNTITSWPTSVWAIISEELFFKEGFQFPETTGPFLVDNQFDGIGVVIPATLSKDIVFGKTLSIKEARDPSYSVLTKKLDGAYQLSYQDTLYFKFEEDYTVQNPGLSYKILNSSNAVVNSSSFLFPAIVKVGDNRFKYYTAELGMGQVYILEVSNSKGDKWYLRFKR